MNQTKEELSNNHCSSPSSIQHSNIAAMQAQQQAMVQQQNQVQQQQAPQQAVAPQQTMQQVMPPQNAPSPVGATTTMPHQSPQFFVQASVGTQMQVPPAIAPAPGPQTSTNTVSTLHHQQAIQPLNHPGVSQSPMPQTLAAGQFPQQVQVLQGGPYLQHVYNNGQGQLIMPLQSAPGMNTQIQQNAAALNTLNQPFQVITAAPGKAFPGQIGPHMIAGKPGVLQGGQATGYAQTAIPTSGSQTLVIGHVGVISSQSPNILPAHCGGPKPGGEMQKVNGTTITQQNPQAVNFPQGSITWAAPGTPIIPNSPIFIRGAQPNQSNVYIQSAPQQMPQQNNMIHSVGSMNQSPIQKPRSGMELQANIQPKTPNTRPPHILPSTPMIRPGPSVSTQTAVGQTIATAQVGNPRSQGKIRGKNAQNRAPQPNMGVQTQQQHQQQQQAQQQHQQAQQQQQQQILQTAPILTQTMPVGISQGITLANGTGGIQTFAPMTSMPQKSQVMTMQSMNQNMAINQKQGIPMTPPTAPIAPPGVQPIVRLPTNKTAPIVSAVSGSQMMATPTPPPQTATPPVAQQQNQPIVTMNNTVMVPHTMAQMTQVQHAQMQNQHQVQMQPNQVHVSQPTQPTQPTTNNNSNQTGMHTIQTQVQPTHQQKGIKVEQKPESTTTKKQYSTAQTPLTTTATSTSVPQLTYSTVNGQASENGEVEEKSTEQVSMNGTVTPPAPISTQGGLPKAMVKPQVLTHVIEGYVIHEASEPFPVNRSSLLSEINKPRNNLTNPHNPLGSAEKENLPNEENKKKDGLSTPVKGDTMVCETCGKMDASAKFKKYKKFCSSACLKKAGSKRGGMFKSPSESPSKKMKEEGQGGEPTTNPVGGGTEVETGMPTMEENGLGQTPSIHPDGGSPSKGPRVDILNWTVRDVVDFIQNLPGCQDYADDFALQEIDGQALMLLNAGHLTSAMSMKLGPALKICAQIDSMRGDRKES